jgi:hypothetical protein
LETVFNDTGANIDFRVESDSNTNALLVDASANQVRIGINGSKSAPSLYFGTDSDTGFYNSGSNGTIYITSNGNNAARISPSQLIVGDETFRDNQNYAGVGLHVDGWIYTNGVEPISSNIFWNGANLCRGLTDRGGYLINYYSSAPEVGLNDREKVVLSVMPSGSATGSQATVSSALRITANYFDGLDHEPNVEIVNRLSIGTLWGGTGTAIGRDATTGEIRATTSDERLKTNIQTITSSLDTIKALRGVQFDWTNEIDPEFKIGSEQSGTQIGLIAQEVEQVLPEVVKPNGVKDYKTVEYDKIVAVLIEAIKEQQLQIDSLQQQINLLRS